MPRGRFSYLLLATYLVVPLSGHAQPQRSDVFSTSGEYDQFAVGGAHRWYDNHTTEAKEKSSHCLSILADAKAFQGRGLALDKAARQLGIDSRQATALRKQANEQFGFRDKKIRAFIECFNLANRQKNPRPDRFATVGDSPGTDNSQTQRETTSSPPSRKRKDNGQKHLPDPTQNPGSDDPETPAEVFSTKGGKPPSDEIQTQSPSGGKSIKRTPKLSGGLDPNVKIRALKKAIDECLNVALPIHVGTDWDRVIPESAGVKSLKPLQQSFYFSGVAAEQVIAFVQARYGDDSDDGLTRDYLIGWLTNCLMDRKVLPRQEPRILYRRYMEAHEPPNNINKKRITKRFEQFGYGGRLYPSIPPFWNHDLAGSPSPTP